MSFTFGKGVYFKSYFVPILVVGRQPIRIYGESQRGYVSRKEHTKAEMKRYIPLETAAIFFLANLFLKQGISSEYVMVDFICMDKLGLQGAKTENYKMKNSYP